MMNGARIGDEARASLEFFWTTTVRDHYDQVLVTAAKSEMDRVLIGR
jgi:hypothetical protein